MAEVKVASGDGAGKTFPLVKQLITTEQKRILVTGGAGFVGSNLVDVLMQQGHIVYVLDNLFTGESLLHCRTYSCSRHAHARALIRSFSVTSVKPLVLAWPVDASPHYHHRTFQ